MLDAIERVEICVRTELVYRLAHAQGPFGHGDPNNLPGLGPDEHAKFIIGDRMGVPDDWRDSPIWK